MTPPYPRVLGPWKDANGIERPGILKTMVLHEQGWAIKPKYFRRGRIVENLASRLAFGNPLPDDDPWWSQASGLASDPDDYLPHEECRPYMAPVRAFVAETNFVLKLYQLKVVYDAPGNEFVGHLDWLGFFKDRPDVWWVVDTKCGRPPQKWIAEGRINPLHEAYERQCCMYSMAFQQKCPKVLPKTATLHLFDGGYKFVERNDYRTRARVQTMVRTYHDMNQFRSE